MNETQQNCVCRLIEDKPYGWAINGSCISYDCPKCGSHWWNSGHGKLWRRLSEEEYQKTFGRAHK